MASLGMAPGLLVIVSLKVRSKDSQVVLKIPILLTTLGFRVRV